MFLDSESEGMKLGEENKGSGYRLMGVSGKADD
jgi:hypothetical protein